jgi:hypothetical protein
MCRLVTGAPGSHYISNVTTSKLDLRVVAHDDSGVQIHSDEGTFPDNVRSELRSKS